MARTANDFIKEDLADMHVQLALRCAEVEQLKEENEALKAVIAGLKKEEK